MDAFMEDKNKHIMGIIGLEKCQTIRMIAISSREGALSPETILK